MKSYNVVCGLIIKDNKVFSCRRGPGRLMEGFYEFPGGKIEVGETKEEALIRELKEELLIDVDIIKYIGHSSYTYPSYGGYDGFHIELDGFIVKIVSGDLTLTEHTEGGFFEIDELKELRFAAADICFIDEVDRYINI